MREILGSMRLWKTLAVPNKRKIRLKRKHDRSDRYGRRRVDIGFRPVRRGVHLKISANIYRAPRWLAARRRNKWGRHVSGYSLFAGKHLLGFSGAPETRRHKDGKDRPVNSGLCCPGQKMQTATLHSSVQCIPSPCCGEETVCRCWPG